MLYVFLQKTGVQKTSNFALIKIVASLV